MFFPHLFQCNGNPFWHKLPSKSTVVLVKFPPPKCPTAVQTRRHAPCSACPECVTVLLFVTVPPWGPYRKSKPPKLCRPDGITMKQRSRSIHCPLNPPHPSTTPLNVSLSTVAGRVKGVCIHCGCIHFYIDYNQKKCS